MFSKCCLFRVGVPLRMKGKKNDLFYLLQDEKGSVVLKNQALGVGYSAFLHPHLVSKFPFSCSLFCKCLGLERGRSLSLCLRTQPLNFSPGWLQCDVPNQREKNYVAALQLLPSVNAVCSLVNVSSDLCSHLLCESSVFLQTTSAALEQMSSWQAYI